MTGINIVTKLSIILAVIIVCAISPCTPKISDRRLCVDPKCSVPISTAITLMNYASNDHGILSFKSNVEVTVFSKSAGDRLDLWGVEIDGRRGYVPKDLLREKRVMKKTLIHELPTEDIDEITRSDAPKGQEEKKENSVPNTLAKSENEPQKIVADPAEKPNTIFEGATVPSVPVLDQVSPSYELHDGTMIPVTRHEEQAKPSYSTQIPQGIQNIEQQPILSIHPSIASTLTLKTGQIPVSEIVDNAATYLEAAGLKDQMLSGEIPGMVPVGLPNEPLVQAAPNFDVNNMNGPKFADPATNVNVVADGNIGDVNKIADVLSSQEKVEKALENDSTKSTSEDIAKNVEHIVTNIESKPEAAVASNNQLLNEIGNKASEQPLLPGIIQNEIVETPKEAVKEFPADNAVTDGIFKNETNSAPPIDINNNIPINTAAEVADNYAATAGNDKKHAAETKDEEDLSDDEESEDDDDEDDEEDDLPEAGDKVEQNKNKLPVEQRPSVAEPIEAKPAEEVPPPNNQHIMSPLFNRFAKIPDMVKNIVEQTISSDDSEQKPLGTPENAVGGEGMVGNSYANEIPKNSEPNSPADFSTGNNYANEYQNETGDSKTSASNPEQGTPNQAANGNDQNAPAAEPEIKNGNVNEIFESRNPNSRADFSTGNNYANEYQNETGDSKTAASTSEPDTANQVANGHDKNAPAAEPEIKNTNVNEIFENRNPNSPVDFSTNYNQANGYQYASDNSKLGAEHLQQFTGNAEAQNFGDKFVNSNNHFAQERSNDITADNAGSITSQVQATEEPVQPGIYKEDELTGFRQDNFARDETSSFNGFPANRNLLNVGSGLQSDDRDYNAQRTNEKILDHQQEPAFNDPKFTDQSVVDSTEVFQIQKPLEISEAKSGDAAITESPGNEYGPETVEIPAMDNLYPKQDVFTEPPDSCLLDASCEKAKSDEGNHNILHENEEEESINDDGETTKPFTIGRSYWETLTYVVLTAFTTLLFSLGYYYIENSRRDAQLIAKINVLEKELLVASKECMVLDDTLKSTKTKLDSIEDESFGSNEMVVSLKAELVASQVAKSELEDQVSMLEKELESATEAGLELERMLREILSTNNQDNPLAQSVEDLQTRLNAQQAANEALTNALNLKAQENETLTADLAAMTQKCEQLEVEVTRVTEELKHQSNMKSNLEQTLLDKVSQLEKQVKDISAERINMRKQLKGKEMELKDLLEVVNQMNINNLDFEKLYNVSRVKAEASQLLEERNELQIRLSEVEGAHQLLEEHVKIINEEVSSLSEQCKLAEKAKRDAETRVEVLSNFFKEKEAQRQKEEAVWLEKQGEVSSTVERLHTMQNEIHNYKQQIEMLKREILDQESEYKNQIATLETKSHEHWVIARQNERRLEESKAEAGQLRNRLTLIEKNLNDTDPEAKLHRLEANGDTATSPQLFIGAEASSSPIMFTGSSGVPYPPPPSYLYGPPPPPFMPPPNHGGPGIPPYEVGQRPPPLGGRLSSPPPLPGSGSGRYDNPRSPPPPLSPSMLPPFVPPHRAFPPSFGNDRIHPPPPPPPHSSMLPPPPLGGSNQSWGNETLPPLRNSGFRGHPQHPRDQQRARNHKGSLHSSGESLDKNV